MLKIDIPWQWFKFFLVSSVSFQDRGHRSQISPFIFSNSDIKKRRVYMGGQTSTVSVTFTHEDHRLYSTVVYLYLPVQISKKAGYPSGVCLFVSFCYFHSQRASFLLNCRSSLPVKISTKPAYSRAVFVISQFHFYS